MKVPYKASYASTFDKTSKAYLGYQRILVDTQLELEAMFEAWDQTEKQWLAFDTETNGLNPKTSVIVGCSLCFDEETAYYLPFRHRLGTNLPISVFKLVMDMLYESAVVFMYNSRFDLRMCRTEGFDIEPIADFDVSVLVWNMDTNIKEIGLKSRSSEILGWKLPNFEDTVGTMKDLSFFRPREVVDYAAYDVLMTYHLYKVCLPHAKEFQFILGLDNRLIRALMAIEDHPHPVGRDVIRQLLGENENKLISLQKAVTEEVGKAFNLNSSQQIVQVLVSLGIDTGERSKKTGKMSASEKALKTVAHLHPAIQMIIDFKKELKFRNSYLEPLMAAFDKDIEGCRFSYKNIRVPTGRLACGSDIKNDYFAHINIQSMPKPKAAWYHAVPNPEGQGILGWDFIPQDEATPEQQKGLLVEAASMEHNIRRAFLPRPGDYFLHCDYKAQEMRIPANLSGDSAMQAMFLSQEDPHKKTAELMLGTENYDKDKRKLAKILNFNVLYGGNKFGIAERLGVSPDEAQEYINKWWGVFPQLQSWALGLQRKGKKVGTIRTAFRRPRRVGHWYTYGDYSEQKFADRTCVNTTVQGTAGDMIRIVLVRLMDAFGDKAEKVQILSTVHDEVNFSISRDYMHEAVPEIIDIMQVEVSGWNVPMEVDFEVGTSWGHCFPFKYIDGEFVPQEG